MTNTQHVSADRKRERIRDDSKIQMEFERRERRKKSTKLENFFCEMINLADTSQ